MGHAIVNAPPAFQEPRPGEVADFFPPPFLISCSLARACAHPQVSGCVFRQERQQTMAELFGSPGWAPASRGRKAGPGDRPPYGSHREEVLWVGAVWVDDGRPGRCGSPAKRGTNSRARSSRAAAPPRCPCRPSFERRRREPQKLGECHPLVPAPHGRVVFRGLTLMPFHANPHTPARGPRLAKDGRRSHPMRGCPVVRSNRFFATRLPRTHNGATAEKISAPRRRRPGGREQAVAKFSTGGEIIFPQRQTPARAGGRKWPVEARGGIEL